MADLDQRFRDADRVPVPELWDEIEMRARLPQRRLEGRLSGAVVAITAAAASLALVLVTFGAIGPSRPSVQAGVNGVLVYTGEGPDPQSIPFENVDVFAIDPTTGERSNLTSTPTVAESAPVWSPDASKVVFERTSATGEGADLQLTNDLVVANADFTAQRVIRRCSQGCGFFDIAWSPDGSRLAWSTDEPVGDGGFVLALETYDLDSGSTTTVCDSRTCGYAGQPAWSPDGTKIAFSDSGSNRLPGVFLPTGPIWVTDVASGYVEAITPRTNTCNPVNDDPCVFDSSPAWSPGGGSIAFVRTTHAGRPDATTDVMIVDGDGSNPRTLFECASNDQCRQGPLAWSPDGASIAFVDRYDRPTLHLIDPVDGSDTPISLPSSAGEYPGPLVWSPDGTQIAFFGGGRLSSLFLVDLDSGEVREVAQQVSSQGSLTWLTAGAVAMPGAGGSAAATPTPSAPTTALPQGSIAFSSSNGSPGEDQGTDIWAMSTDGTGLVNLTDNQSFDSEPAFSPDGTRIAFESYRPDDRNTQIYVMDADGTDQHEITDHRTGAVEPAWSPGGTQIAFVSSAGYGHSGGVFVIDADGSNEHLVAEGNAFDPSWSPDGHWIVYALDGPDGHLHLQFVDLDAGTPNNEPPALPGDQQQPAWSPDGQTIAFVWGSGSGSAIFEMHLDGSNLRKVAQGTDPAWSPDGRWLVFTHTDDATGPQIWVVEADGSGGYPLTSMPGFLSGTPIFAITGGPAWGPARR